MKLNRQNRRRVPQWPMFSLVAVLMLLMWTSLPAYGHTLNGRVVGGGQDHSIWVVAVGSRNLQGPENILGKSRVDPKSGLFSISELSVSKLYLIVTVDCVSSVIDAGDLNGCRLLFPRIASIDPSSDKTYELQIPDLKKAQAIWRGDTASEGPHRSAGFAFLVLWSLQVCGCFGKSRSNRHMCWGTGYRSHVNLCQTWRSGGRLSF